MRMNALWQHIPGFANDGSPPPVGEFASTAALLALDIVKRHGKGPDFSHFAMSDDKLMAISDGGFH